MNLVTPAKRIAAAALVREGISVSLSQDVLKEEAVDNPNPFEHTMRSVGSDAFAVSYHGWAHTHLDALAHVRDDGAMYNDYRPDESRVMEAGGHARNSIHNLKSGVFTRGILMDMPRLHGLPYLDPETPIYVEDLEAWERAAGDLGRWEFLLTAAPLAVWGGTGSPINPIATF